jgi:SAM-dependent methyltransferase
MEPESKKTDENAFTASSGRKVEFIPGYLDFMKAVVGMPTTTSKDIEIAATNVGGDAAAFDYQRAATLAEDAPRLSLLGYSARYANAYRLTKILESGGLPNQFGSMLDIGCGHGVQPRILHGLGIVNHCTGIDLFDRATSIDEDHLRRQHRKLRWMKHVDRYHSRILRKPPSKRSDLDNAILSKGVNLRDRIHKKAGWKPEMDFYSLPLKQQPKLDRFIAGNVFELEEKFDLVTAFSAVEWFNYEDILSKISDLLEDGGVLYFYVANWWHSVTGGRVAGHFPFAAQRLTQEDFRRYVESELPEFAEPLKKHYDFFDPGHPTMSDYLDAAANHNLLPVWYQSCVSPVNYSPKFGLTSRGWGEMQMSELDEVLEDMRQFKPNISIADIMPLTHYMAFQKVDPNRHIAREEFANFATDNQTPYQPTGMIGKAVKSVGLKILNKT